MREEMKGEILNKIKEFDQAGLIERAEALRELLEDIDRIESPTFGG